MDPLNACTMELVKPNKDNLVMLSVAEYIMFCLFLL